MKHFLIAMAVTIVPAVGLAQQDDPFGYEFDDYLCHDIPKANWLKPKYGFEMKDQFGEAYGGGLRAMFICNPVKKRVTVNYKKNSEDGITNPELHLMCYEFDLAKTDATNVQFEVHNQFEEDNYTTRDPRMICVPSLKRHF